MTKAKDKEFAAASLRLFNCVPAGNTDGVTPYAFEIVKEYGVVISPSAISYAKEIKQYLKKHKVSDKQLNQTFYSTPDEVEGKTLFERLVDQLTHYFSTYGLKALGIESDFMYIPNNWERLNLPERIKFNVIVGVDTKELTERSLQMLATGVALKQETIEDVLTVLEGCLYQWNGEEVVKNKEARVIIADKTGILPVNGEDLFRYLFYKATGSSLVISNKDTLTQIKYSQYKLPELSERQIIQLAKSYNRRKAYWMALKLADRKVNGPVINRMAKLSKKVHVPMPVDVLGSLTNQVFTKEELSKAIENANTFRLVRALNALNEYSEFSGNPHFYRIRNGKGFIKNGVERQVDSSPVQALKDAISQHIDRKPTVYIPPGVVYAMPTSEKQFSTNIPNFSYVEVDPSDRDLMVGIYWENASSYHTDFDLSCNSLDGSRVGWNALWNNQSLVHSGDVTNAPLGAAEWFVIRSLEEPWLVTVNLFSGPSQAPFKIMVGYGDDKVKGNYRNYFMKPDDVLFVAEAIAIQKQSILGVIAPTKDGKTRFTLVNRGGNNRNVSGPDGLNTSTIAALLPQANTCATLNEFVQMQLCDSPEEADIDLSPGKVSKDSLLSLYV